MTAENRNATPNAENLALARAVQAWGQKVATNVEKVIVGKRDVIDLALVALLCEGHILLEDVPGVGKTMMARALAASIGGEFRRLQFTPDLLPNDVIGVSVFDQRTAQFTFQPGPVFTNILLADEINRATPRAQSALLEAMGEKQVTVEGVSRQLAKPFLVLATQNPVEQEGTFPLPEAQLDRFMLKVKMGYPSPADERVMMRNLQISHPIERVQAVSNPVELVGFQSQIGSIFVDDSILDYVVRLVNATRNHADLNLGASPRATIALFKTAQARAALQGRDYVTPDDVKLMAPPVLTHRILVRAESSLRGRQTDDVIRDIMNRIEPPIDLRAAQVNARPNAVPNPTTGRG